MRVSGSIGYGHLPYEVKREIAANFVDPCADPKSFANLGQVNKEAKKIHDDLFAFPDAAGEIKTQQRLLKKAIAARQESYRAKVDPLDSQIRQEFFRRINRRRPAPQPGEFHLDVPVDRPVAANHYRLSEEHYRQVDPQYWGILSEADDDMARTRGKEPITLDDILAAIQHAAPLFPENV